MNASLRQQLTIIFLIVTLAILAWQGYALYSENFGSSHSTTTTTVEQPIQESFQKVTPQPEPSAQQQAAPTIANAPEPEANNEILTDEQKEYLTLTAKLQNLQIEERIAQTQQAIYEAKLKTAEAQEKLQQVSGSITSSPTIDSSAVNNVDAYHLVYIGQTDGQWTATLKKNDSLLSVNVGSVVSDLGTVQQIQPDKILFKSNTMQTEIGFKQTQQFPIPQAVAQQTDTGKQQVAASDAVDAASKVQELQPQIPNPPQNSIDAKQSVTTPIKPALDTSSGIPAEAGISPHLSAAETQQKQMVLQFDSAFQNQNNANQDAVNPAYTVQLMASLSRRQVESFQDQNQLKQTTKINTETRNNQQWYILTLGTYPTIQDAKNAIEQLPQSVQQWRPFVKKIG